MAAKPAEFRPQGRNKTKRHVHERNCCLFRASESEVPGLEPASSWHITTSKTHRPWTLKHLGSAAPNRSSSV